MSFWLSAFILMGVLPANAAKKSYPDIAVTNLNDGTVSVVLNSRGNNFDPLLPNLDAGPVPVFVATGDFNNDGITDLVVNDVNGQLKFLIGQKCQGVFIPLAQPLNVGYPLSDTLAVGDFNNDGNDDILISSQSDFVQLLKGDGNLSGDPNVHFTKDEQDKVHGFSRANCVEAADFNGDGYLDAAVCDYGASNVHILKNEGATNPGKLTDQQTLPSASQPHDIGVGDFNGDGKMDFAVTGGTTWNIYVYLGDASGNGTFGSGITVNTGSGSDDGISSIAVADFDNDGKDDFVTRGRTADLHNLLEVWLWKGVDPNNPFVLNWSAPEGSMPPNNVSQAGLTAADFNSDGVMDVAFTKAPVLNAVDIYYGEKHGKKGTGKLLFQKEVTVGNYPSHLAVGDF